MERKLEHCEGGERGIRGTKEREKEENVSKELGYRRKSRVEIRCQGNRLIGKDKRNE